MALKDSGVYQDMTKNELVYELSKRNAKNPYEAAEAGVMGAVAPKAPTEELTQVPPPLAQGEQLVNPQAPQGGGFGDFWKAGSSFLETLAKPIQQLNQTNMGQAIQKGTEAVGKAASNIPMEHQAPAMAAGAEVGKAAAKTGAGDLATQGPISVSQSLLKALTDSFKSGVEQLPITDRAKLAEGLEQQQKLDAVKKNPAAMDVYSRTGDLSLASSVVEGSYNQRTDQQGPYKGQTGVTSGQTMDQPRGPGTFQNDVAGKAPMTDTTGQGFESGLDSLSKRVEKQAPGKMDYVMGGLASLVGDFNNPWNQGIAEWKKSKAQFKRTEAEATKEMYTAQHKPQTKQEIAQMSLDSVSKSLDANLRQGQDIQGMFEQSWNRKNIGQKWVGGWSKTEREKLLPAYLDNLDERAALIKAMMEKGGKSSPTATAKKGVIDPELKKAMLKRGIQNV
jgi:hypothetical protein